MYQNFYNPPKEEFYYWRSVYDVKQDAYPRYIKVLDFGYGKSLRVVRTRFKTKPKEFARVIYIDNRVFKNIKPKTLLKKINLKNPKEIQIDCDWNGSTKKSYFNFLKLLHKKYPSSTLTATIRLHQVKFYKKTGVPPVSRGVLMFYNMSDFLNPNTKNYILDFEVAKTYLKNFDSYPLKLDIALPLYSQATIIRFGKVVGLKEGVRKKDMKNPNFLPLGNNRYRVKKTFYFKGTLLYKGDFLRVDEVSKKELKRAFKLLKYYIRNKIERVIYFRWEYRENLS